MENKDIALPSDRAVVNGAQEVSAVPASVPSAGGEYPERIWFTPVDNGSREYVRCDLYDQAQQEVAELRKWRKDRRITLDSLIDAAAVFWGRGSEQHNLVRDVSDAMFRAARSDETHSGSAVGKSPVAESDAPNPTDQEGSR